MSDRVGPGGVRVHDKQHATIKQRIKAWQTKRIASTADWDDRDTLRREAYWALRGHLQSEHGERVVDVPGVFDLADLHHQLHAQPVEDSPFALVCPACGGPNIEEEDVRRGEYICRDCGEWIDT